MNNKNKSVGQSKRASLFESVLNTATGFLIGLLTQVIVFGMYGIEVSATDNVTIALVFALVSVVRSYTFRRIFNYFSQR